LRKRRRLVVATGALVLAAAVVYLLIPGPDLRAGSKALPNGPVRVAERTPRAYRIDYRVEDRAGGEFNVSTERLWVRRPYEARVEDRSGPPPGRRRTSETISAFARVRVGGSTFAVAPAPASPDRRVEHVLDEAQSAGYVQARERRRVAGRLCRVFRTAGESPSGTLTKLRGGAKDYTDVCLDSSGLALEEATFAGGKLVARRLAVKVEESPRSKRNLFETGKPSATARQGGGSVKWAELDSRPPGTFWEPSTRLKGFEHRGRYAVVPPQAGFDDPTQRSSIIAFISDVWERGLDVVAIEQGATLGGKAPFAADPNAVRVRVGRLGRGELLYGLRTSEVRVLRKGGRFVRVFGTIEPSRLLAFARSLEEKPGGNLVYID
jgi:hypothetical protein